MRKHYLSVLLLGTEDKKVILLVQLYLDTT
jgi:hypothetical protein